MQESDVLAFSANSRFLIYQSNAGSSAALQRGREVVDDKADVMDSRPPLGDEFANG